MKLIDILTPIVICIVGILLGYYFNRKLESLKRLLNIQEKLIQRKVEVYPRFIAPIYRIRNLLRDFINDGNLDLKLIDNLNMQVENLKNTLIEYRLDLDDSDFKIIHAYKNKSIYLSHLFEDLQFYTKRNDTQRKNEIKENLRRLLDEIEGAYKIIANKLSFSNLAVAPDKNKIDADN